jgi:hypothetical protein
MATFRYHLRQRRARRYNERKARSYLVTAPDGLFGDFIDNMIDDAYEFWLTRHQQTLNRRARSRFRALGRWGR